MTIRVGLALLLGILIGSVATFLFERSASREAPQGIVYSSHPDLPDPSMPPVVTHRDPIEPRARTEGGIDYPPVRVRWEPELKVTNERYDCLNWPEGLEPDRRLVDARLSKDHHELEIRVGYTLGTIHSAAILTLRDDQTADAAVRLDSDFGQLDEDSAHRLTGEISVNSLDWSDPYICGTFELHWTKEGSGSCQHGSFSIDQSQIER